MSLTSELPPPHADAHRKSRARGDPWRSPKHDISGKNAIVGPEAETRHSWPNAGSRAVLLAQPVPQNCMRRSLADRYHLVLFWDQRGNGLSERITASEYDRERIREGIAAAPRQIPKLAGRASLEVLGMGYTVSVTTSPDDSFLVTSGSDAIVAALVP